MKLTLFLMLGVVAVVTAIPSATAPTATANNIVANFDDLTVGRPIPTPYHQLSFTNLSIENVGVGSQTRGIIPHSKPNYALSGPYSNSDYYAPRLDVAGTSTSFTLHDVWVGCLAENGITPVQCSLFIQCTEPGTREGNEAVYPLPQFVPSGATGAKMLHAEVGLLHCSSLYFKVVQSAVELNETLLVTDSFNYTIYQGETFYGPR